MSTGLLDLPAPLLAVVDAGMASVGVPALLRVLAWGVLGGAVGMWLYRRYSPQQRIAEARQQLRVVQKQLADYDGEFAGLRGLISRQFGLVFTQLRLTAAAALLAGVPVLLILPWLSNTYDARYPQPGQSVTVCATPTEVAADLSWQPGSVTAAVEPGCWMLQWPDGAAPARLIEAGVTLLDIPTAVPARIVHRRGVLNWLIGNPAGYLPDNARTQAVTLAIPNAELVAIGPSWLRGWEAAFFTAALLVSLWLRSRWKLQ